MNDNEIENRNLAALKEISAELMGARLEVARMRKYPGKPAAAAVRDLEDFHNVRRRTYYSHEAGEKKPKLPMLRIYSQLFDVALDYFLYGTDAQIYETEARAIAAEQKTALRIDFNQDEQSSSALPINQRAQQFDINSSHNSSHRFIVLLSAGDIKKLSTGRGDLTQMSGRTLPAPGFVEASEDSFWYQIPAHDFSMVNGDGPSLPPGTICLADRDHERAPIEPGRFVIVDLDGREEPLIRRYVADRSYTSGVRFSLEPLNPRSETIDVTDPSQCLLIARIIFYGLRS